MIILVSVVRNRLSTEQTPVERLRERYANSEIDETEFDRQLEFHLDDRNAQIRLVVEDVNGVGPETSKVIAAEFESLDELRVIDRGRFKDVPGVGEKTAAAVLERVQ